MSGVDRGSVTIRPEKPEEFAAIYDLVKLAFATARVSDGSEQDFVDQLRAGSGYIPELALVAEEQGQLTGHIMLTRLPYSPGPQEGEGAEGKGAEARFLLLAPLCVVLAKRNFGLGALLVREAMARARSMGYTAVILVGDAGYYGRFGFEGVSAYKVRYTPEELPAEHVLACELVPGALRGKGGVLRIC